MFTNASHLFIVQLLSHVWFLAIPWTAAWQASLSFTIFLRVCSNSCPLSQCCHPTNSSSVAPFSSHPQYLPASGSFQMSQLFTFSSQSFGVSASPSAFQMNIQGWFPLGWTGWISLLTKGLYESFPTPQFKSINSLVLSLLYGPPLTSAHEC